MEHSQILASLPVPQAISVLLLMFTRQVRHRRSLSKDHIPLRLSLGSFSPGQGRGTVAGRRNPAPRCLRNTIGPALPPAISGSASHSRAQVRRGELLGPRQHAAAPGISAYRRLLPGGGGGKGIFRAVDLTPAEFPLL